MVGYRFANLRIDESPFLAHKTEKGVIEFSIASSDAKVSESLYKDRRVIELGVQVKALNQGGSDESFLVAECIAGFVGQDESLDGDVERFSHCEAFYVRSLYWLIRQRLASLLTMTRFRQVRLPSDFDGFETKSSARNTSAKSSKRRTPARKNRKGVRKTHL